MANDRSYNGWTNYETWNVNLWLDNEPGAYEDKREIIRRAGNKWEAEKDLRAYVEDMMPDLGASMWADLLGAAMSEVNWGEIIHNEWDELHPTEESAEELDEE